jgi:ribonuclease HI
LRAHPGAGLKKTLRLRTDGASRGNPGPASVGVVIEDDQGMRLRGFHRKIGIATNNEAEYQALIDGLEAVSEWKPDRLEIYLDSKLIVEQIKGGYRVKDVKLLPLHRRAKELLGGFAEVDIAYNERERNKGADALANLALDEHKKKGSAPGG